MRNLIFLLILIPALVIFGCGSNANEGDGDAGNTDVVSAEEEEWEGDGDPADKWKSMDEVLAGLKVADFPQEWGEEFLMNSRFENPVTVSVENFNSFNLLKDSWAEDSVSFLWKYPMENITLLCFETMSWGTKGPSFEYYLVSLNKDNKKIDDLLFAGDYSVPVDNGMGGTSAGEEFLYAMIDSPEKLIRVEDYDHTLEYYTDEAGKFRIKREKPVLDVKFKTDAYLNSIVNNIDYIAFDFTQGKENLSFIFQSEELTDPKNPYFEYVEGEGVVSQISVKDGARDWYTLTYQFEIRQLPLSDEEDTVMVLLNME